MIFLEPLRETFRRIDANPQNWNQATWGEQTACGTSFCVAGDITAAHAQVPLVWVDWGTALCLQGVSTQETFTSGELEKGLVFRSNIPPESIIHPAAFAASVIIKGEELADRIARSLLEEMFNADNSRCDLQDYAERIAELAGEPWGVPLPDWA